MRRLVFVVIGLGLIAVVAIGLAQGNGTNAPPKSATVSAAEARAKLAGSPAPLAALHAQSSDLLAGTPADLRSRLAALKGHPVVLNGWASWCGPCRFEFPFYQRASVDLGRRVAFVGLNAGDNHGDAQRFLRKFPVSYPSYEDPAYKTVFALKAPKGLPFTIFYAADGTQSYVHQGGYASQAKLEQDIRRYAIGAA